MGSYDHDVGRADAKLMTIRVFSELEDFSGCFVEVADAWTVRELNALYENRDRWLEMWRRKVVGCRIETGDGEVLTDPEQVVERWDDLDVRLAKFINTSLAAAVDHLATLGGQRRRISSGAGDSPATTRTPTT